jgi:hypothetical protein
MFFVLLSKGRVIRFKMAKLYFDDGAAIFVCRITCGECKEKVSIFIFLNPSQRNLAPLTMHNSP